MSAARTLALRTTRPRLVHAPRPARRFQSTSAAAPSSTQSHVAAGLAGGALVLAGGYVWYRVSGLKPVVDASKRVHSALAAAPAPDDALTMLLGARSGPKARALYDDAAARLAGAFAGGASPEAVAKAVAIAWEKLDEARALAADAARDAWDAAREKAAPVLDTMPDVRAALDDNADALLSAGGAAAAIGGGGGLREIWERVKDVAEREGGVDAQSVAELKKFVLNKVDAAKKGGKGAVDSAVETVTSGGLEGVLAAIPGGKKMLDSTPDLKELFKVVQERGEDAQALAKETYEDLFAVLKDKAAKAKKLSGDAVKDVKDTAQSDRKDGDGDSDKKTGEKDSKDAAAKGKDGDGKDKKDAGNKEDKSGKGDKRGKGDDKKGDEQKDDGKRSRR